MNPMQQIAICVENDELKAEVERLRALTVRAMSIITNAIMHGMPITEEVAAVRNEIVCGKK